MSAAGYCYEAIDRKIQDTQWQLLRCRRPAGSYSVRQFYAGQSNVGMSASAGIGEGLGWVHRDPHRLLYDTVKTSAGSISEESVLLPLHWSYEKLEAI